MGASSQLSLLGHEANRVEVASLSECNSLLAEFHYLGPIRSSLLNLGVWNESGELTQCQVWKWPTARLVPNDWFELARWCLTPLSVKNDGSRFHGQAVRVIRSTFPEVKTLVSYSDMTRHTGALYKACNWVEAPTHHADRFRANGKGYPSGHGNWNGGDRQEPKLRWTFPLA